ncbi:uncharacterized protein LOC141720029 [Apium graveolens]|uniref:uncharacterized protein LOC141720029 n=1 Tax=Apium graveolens TaxID=4045 RepID=UPI003D7C0175
MADNFDIYKEFAKEMFNEDDDEYEKYRLHLFNKIQGEGSSSTPRRTVYRGREADHERLVKDYFTENPVYTPETFRRRFRMGKHVFLRIVDAQSNFDPYFQQRVDALGRKGLSPLQKCTATMRMLVYGVSADVVDNCVRIGKTTVITCLKKFVTDVILMFENEYLRKPDSNDV